MDSAYPRRAYPGSIYPDLGRPLVVGHRGLREPGAPPENTLEAIEAALAQGADGVEIDVRLSADGAPVVLHDPTLDGRPVDTLSTAELRRVDLGGGARVPLLEEVIALCGERELWLNVELKHDLRHKHALVAAVAAALRGRSRAVSSSFDPRLLRRLQLEAPELPVALLVERRGTLRRLADRLARPLGAAGVHPHHELVTPRSLARWRRAGLAVAVWTVNDEARMRALADLGVDAIITDHPARLRAILSRRS